MIAIIKHEEIEGPGTLGSFFRATGRWQIKTIELSKGDILPGADECKAVVLLGGPMNVYEEVKYPFLAAENKFLRRLIEKCVPTLGICLGAQLLAKAAGLKVTKSGEKEIGWYKVQLTKEAATQDPLFKGLTDNLDVFQWHEDTFEVNGTVKLLATSKTCHNQALRIGNCAWGLQFHPELNLRMIEDWIEVYGEKTKREAMTKMYFEKRDTYQGQAQIIYKNFAQVIEGKSRD